MVKVEDFQQLGKDQFEAGVPAANAVSQSIQAIASAFGEYSKKSFEDGSAFVEKLAGVKTIDKAIELQTEYARSSYESFVTGSQKIAGLYADLAKQTFKPFEGYVGKFSPTANS